MSVSLKSSVAARNLIREEASQLTKNLPSQSPADVVVNSYVAFVVENRQSSYESPDVSRLSLQIYPTSCANVAPRDFVVLGTEVQIPLFQANGILSRTMRNLNLHYEIKAFKPKVLAICSSFVTDYFSGPDRATSPVCVCVSGQ